MADLAFPWAGESAPRPAPACTLAQLLFAAACVQHRFQLRCLAEALAERQAIP